MIGILFSKQIKIIRSVLNEFAQYAKCCILVLNNFVTNSSSVTLLHIRPHQHCYIFDITNIVTYKFSKYHTVLYVHTVTSSLNFAPERDLKTNILC